MHVCVLFVSQEMELEGYNKVSIVMVCDGVCVMVCVCVCVCDGVCVMVCV